MRISDWSSDVCSSDLGAEVAAVWPLHHPCLGLDQHAVAAHSRFDARLSRLPARHPPADLAHAARRPAHGLRYRDHGDRKSTRLNYSHSYATRIPSYA